MHVLKDNQHVHRFGFGSTDDKLHRQTHICEQAQINTPLDKHLRQSLFVCLSLTNTVSHTHSLISFSHPFFLFLLPFFFSFLSFFQRKISTCHSSSLRPSYLHRDGWKGIVTVSLLLVLYHDVKYGYSVLVQTGTESVKMSTSLYEWHIFL